MSVQPTYPGVYSQTLPSGVRTITGVSTSVTGFVGRARKGSVTAPIRCFSFADFERACGGLRADSELGYAVQQYFANGGNVAVIARVATGATTASTSIAGQDGGSNFDLTAANPGAWGSNLRVTVEHGVPGEASEAPGPDAFHLIVEEVDPLLLVSDPARAIVAREEFRQVSVDPLSPRYIERILQSQSVLVRAASVSADRPVEVAEQDFGAAVDGGNGSVVAYQAAVNRLELAEDVSLLCIPPLNREADIPIAVLTDALDFCTEHRAVLLIDPRAEWGDYQAAANLAGGADSLRSRHSAFFYPRISAADALQEGRVRSFVPSGAIAGVMARTDATRGVWKASAGIEAMLRNVAGPQVALTDPENGVVNERGVNAIREMPVVGTVVWGARTAVGADALASEWKYLPVTRTALFIESSLRRGVQWAVFEPNDERLWAQLRGAVGTFLHTMFRQGAFAGTRPSESYFVRCDDKTTTEADTDRGVVNIVVGFAPLKPAEFVVLKFQQIAGRS